MHSPFARLNRQPSDAEVRRLGFIFLPAALAQGTVLALLGRLATGHWWWQAALTVAIVGWAIGLVLLSLPSRMRWFSVAWHGLAALTEWTLGLVTLTIFYWLILTPVGLILRRRRPHPLTRKPDPTQPTYWQDCGPPPPPERYFRRW